MVFWHPKGWSIWQQVEQYMRRVYRDNGYQEVQRAADPRPVAVGALGPLGELPREHVHDGVGEARLRGEADELPGPRADLQRRPAQLPRPAAALRRVRRVPPQRAVGRAARHHARARASRRTTATSSARRSRSSPSAWRSTSARSTSTATSASATSRSSSRCGPTKRLGERRAVGPRRERAAQRAARVRRRMAGAARRRRVLRAEDRVPPEGLHRPAVAVRHDAGRLHDAGPARRRVRRPRTTRARRR